MRRCRFLRRALLLGALLALLSIFAHADSVTDTIGVYIG